jgi:hypothetical protein
MYKTDNPTKLNPNRIIHDPALINYLFEKGVPIYIIKERNNIDNYFAIAGREIDKELKEYNNGR